MNYNIASFKERPDLYDIQEEICSKAFPTFLYYSEIATNTWDKMEEYYKEYQLLFLHDGKIICVFNCMPMNQDFYDEELPDNAFEWGMQKGIKDYEEGKEINAALGVQIIIPKEYQGKGISRAVEIKGTIKQWETWAQMSFPESGMYVVDGALCPVKIYRENNLGLYIEPNVWVSYEMSV